VLEHSGIQVDQIGCGTTPRVVDCDRGGHSNTLLSNTKKRAEGCVPHDVKETAIVQAYAYGKFLGELNVTFDDEGNIKELGRADPDRLAGRCEDETKPSRCHQRVGPTP